MNPASIVVAALFFTAFQSVAQRSQLPVERQLGRAVTLYATDDDTGEAERLLLAVSRASSATAKDRETARYYLGRSYHRNYYMLRQSNSLNLAVDRYKEIHQTAEGGKGPSLWYADARFYKSLAYLELGKWKDAYEAIEHIRPALDAEIEVDYLVWSVSRKSINRKFPSQGLRDRYLELLKAQGVTRDQRDGVNRVKRDAVLRALEAMLDGWYRVQRSVR